MHSLHCRMRLQPPLSWDIHNFQAVTLHNDMCTWLEVCPHVSIIILFINISITENTNSISSWWLIQQPDMGKGQSYTNA